MDLTYFTHTHRRPRDGSLYDIRSTKPEPPATYGELVQTERTTLHLGIGDPVLVRAYGRHRHGTVTKLGRTRVTVDFLRNRDGDRASRAFGAWELEPTEGTAFSREVVA